MRLIDAPIGIFRFDGELVLKTEYYSKDKQSGKYIPDCYIIRTGEYFWGGAKTANELINLDIEPVDFAELLPTVADTISRQAAIDAINSYFGFNIGEEYGSAVQEVINGLPPAQSEQRWIPVTERLPEEYGEYICIMENRQVQECGFVPENQRGLVDGWSTCEADGHKFLGYADVLAWMPLPEPWKEGEADE